MADLRYEVLLSAVREWQKSLLSADDDEIREGREGLLAQIPTPQVRIPKLDLIAIARLVPKEHLDQALEIAAIAERAIAFSKDLTVLVKEAGVLSLNDAANKVDVQIAAKEAAEVTA
jgi:hypothetical protein